MGGSWEERRVRTDACVMPGRIMLSSGGVTTSRSAERASKHGERRKHGPRKRLTIVRTLKDSKGVHGTSFGNGLIEQPQNLLVPSRGSGTLRLETRCIFQSQLEATRTTGLRAQLVAHGD